MLKGIEIIKDRLQRKRKQYIHQGEKNRTNEVYNAKHR